MLGDPAHPGDLTPAAAPAPNVEQVVRNLGRGMMSLHRKLDDLQEQLSAAAIGGAAPSGGRDDGLGFEIAADAIDGLDRALDELSRVITGALASPEPEPEPVGLLAQAKRQLRRALHTDDDRRPDRSARLDAARDAIGSVCEGLRLLRAHALERLAGAGIEASPTEGEFDPRVHQVLGTERGAYPGRILRTVRRGYTKSGEPIRAAMVIVTGPADANEEELR